MDIFDIYWDVIINSIKTVLFKSDLIWVPKYVHKVAILLQSAQSKSRCCDFSKKQLFSGYV